LLGPFLKEGTNGLAETDIRLEEFELWVLMAVESEAGSGKG
jgi:hypothetical protein